VGPVYCVQYATVQFYVDGPSAPNNESAGRSASGADIRIGRQSTATIWRISDKERSPKNPQVTTAFWPIASIVEIREF
jgi:hypothetical protein